MDGRGPDGKWLPGFCPNPGGISPGKRRALEHVSQLARECTEEAIATLKGIMLDPKMPAPSRVQAAVALLDRGYGRAAMNVTPEHRPAVVDIRSISVLEQARRVAFLLSQGERLVRGLPSALGAAEHNLPKEGDEEEVDADAE
jgi:hypothetical protein